MAETASQFRKCENPKCSQTLFVKDIERNLYCCKYCGYHFRIGSAIRIKITLDPGTWSELFEGIGPVDALKFKGKRPYPDSIKRDQKKTGLKDAVVCGTAKLDGRELVCAVMDFQFIGGSMGSVVGEKVTRAVEYATAERLPIVIFCCSGGARMQEGALSLMQMAKTSAAIQRHNEAKLPFFTVLTDPTLAGVSASYAFLADVIIGEPKAMIGFTGARVIEQTIRKKLPEGFQEAEFLLEHGQIDMVVPRKEIRDVLAKLLGYAVGSRLEADSPRKAAAAPAPSKTRKAAKATSKSKKKKRAEKNAGAAAIGKSAPAKKVRKPAAAKKARKKAR